MGGYTRHGGLGSETVNSSTTKVAASGSGYGFFRPRRRRQDRGVPAARTRSGFWAATAHYSQNGRLFIDVRSACRMDVTVPLISENGPGSTLRLGKARQRNREPFCAGISHCFMRAGYWALVRPSQQRCWAGRKLKDNYEILDPHSVWSRHPLWFCVLSSSNKRPDGFTIRRSR